MIDINTSLFVWLIIFIVILILAKIYGISWFSSIALALIVAIIILSLIAPTSSIEQMFESESNDLVSLYWAIWIFTGLYLLLYILKKSFEDREAILRKTCSKLTNLEPTYSFDQLGTDIFIIP